MKVSKTGRGFTVARFKDSNGAECTIQHSSAIDDTERGMSQPGSSFLWIGPNDADPKIMASQAAAHGVKTDQNVGWITYPVPPEVLMTTRMHVNRKQVGETVKALQRWLRTGSLKVRSPGKSKNRVHYVQVVKEPATGEGTGESKEDLKSLLNHVGIVVDADFEDQTNFVRFFDAEGKTFCRWIEMDCLESLADSPSIAVQITDHFWEQGD